MLWLANHHWTIPQLKHRCARSLGRSKTVQATDTAVQWGQATLRALDHKIRPARKQHGEASLIKAWNESKPASPLFSRWKDRPGVTGHSL